METLTEKICTKCRIEKPPSAFHKDSRAKDGLSSHCKSCHAVSSAAYRKTTRGKAKHRGYAKVHRATTKGRLSQRNGHYKYSYGKGMSIEKYDEMFSAQGGLCAICGNPETRVVKSTGRVRELDVDHNHETGQIRELLCHCCNVAIGLLKHDKVRLSKAVTYLVKHEG